MRRRLVALGVGGLILAAMQANSAQALDLWFFQGVITSTSGTPQPGVSVRNGGQVTVTDAQGHYRLGQLLPGTYTLRASKACFGDEEAQVTVLVPKDTDVDFVLTPVC